MGLLYTNNIYKYSVLMSYFLLKYTVEVALKILTEKTMCCENEATDAK